MTPKQIGYGMGLIFDAFKSLPEDKNIIIDDFNYLAQDFYMANAMKGGWDRVCVPA